MSAAANQPSPADSAHTAADAASPPPSADKFSPSPDDDESGVCSLLLSLPPDLLLFTLLPELPVSVVLILRCCCKPLRQATSDAELWAVLAAQRWVEVQASRHSPTPRRAAAPASECAAVTPHVLSPFASLVDVALRLAPMPAVMRPCVADEAEAGGGTPHAVVVGQDGASLRFGPSPRHLCAVADRGFPVAGARDGCLEAAVSGTVPFATDGRGLGAPGRRGPPSVYPTPHLYPTPRPALAHLSLANLAASGAFLASRAHPPPASCNRPAAQVEPPDDSLL